MLNTPKEGIQPDTLDRPLVASVSDGIRVKLIEIRPASGKSPKSFSVLARLGIWGTKSYEWIHLTGFPNLGDLSMVYLSRIYTKSGDGGETGLGDGTRVTKNHHRVHAMGEVDELNACLGLLHAHCPETPERDLLRVIQNDLFDLGGDLCFPITENETGMLRITAAQCERLEKVIDRLNEHLEPLNSFILPGGSPAAAWLHLARTVCRRAERSVVALRAVEPINDQTLIYLNRLSDLLFVLGRVANNHGAADVKWIPGQHRGS